MGKSTNNEHSCLEYLEECVPPYIFFETYGGSAANVPDIMAVDVNDPFAYSRQSVMKAHYIIIGNKLYLHTPGIDPWNIEQVYNELDLKFEPLEDKLLQITKRPAGAKRKSGSKGGEPLEPGDSRYVSFGLRFWVDIPKHGIDLANPDHQAVINEVLWDLDSDKDHIPYATFDAKTEEKTQFLGPSVVINRNPEGFDLQVPDFGPFSGSIADQLGKAVLSDESMVVKINEYFDTLGTNCSSFKVVADDSNEEGVPEHRYKSTCFNETLELDLGLVSITSIKEVKNGLSKETPRTPKARKQKASKAIQESER